MKKISMTYQEYLDEIEAAKNEIEMKWRIPILDLCKMEFFHDNISFNGKTARYAFKGSKEELLDALSKIARAETLQEVLRRL
jgi:hypothetical protein